MADTGVLSGLLQGLTSGINSYQQVSDRKRADKERAQAYAAQGFNVDEDGNLTPGAGLLAKQQLDQSNAQAALDARTPGSDLSKRRQGLISDLTATSDPDLSKRLKDGNYSAEDLDKESGLLAKNTTGAYGVQGRGLSNDRMMQKNDIAQQNLDLRKQGLGLREDMVGARAADTIHKNSNIAALNTQIQKGDRAAELLSKPGLTNQEFNDVQAELSNAISGAGSSAIGKLERTEYDSMQQRLAGFKQEITGEPQEAVPPEILARVQSLVNDFNTKMKANRYQQAQNLSRSYGSQRATQNQAEAIGRYAPQTQAQDMGPSSGGLLAQTPQGQQQAASPNPTAPAQAKQLTPQDQAAVQWAQANKTDPRAAAILKSNGL